MIFYVEQNLHGPVVGIFLIVFVAVAVQRDGVTDRTKCRNFTVFQHHFVFTKLLRQSMLLARIITIQKITTCLVGQDRCGW